MHPANDPAAPSAGPEWVLTLSCPDRPGIVHAVSGVIAGLGGNITESQQFGSPVTGRFYMRVQVALPGAPDDGAAALRDALGPVVAEFDLVWGLDRVGRAVPTVIMVSKEAHCLNDLLFRQRAGDLPLDVVAVVGNHPDLAELTTFYGVPFHHVPVTRDTKPEAEAELLRIVAGTGAELVVLARYMQILSDELCARLAGHVINIHHSFLPSFKGARPYHQAFERGVKLIGATSHYVTGDLDEGPIIEQEVERVDHTRNPAELVALGQDVERRTLARAVRWHAEHRVLLDGLRTVVFR
ncbi:formyltetrahydrofolate deformylase [Luteimicrobium album]|uniref:Formyltetrahydrofolate deformylase n=1 Tax=Luteimicrobium album TaxID=1054550 RepID=A0ABQ6HW47_9MICO|nr:formyltetrahydrofolate deformylase [Luteimicrobium album]GMA22580.1 formyltetrahydrofolate deformylase [Luteimicrobium album]